MVAAIVNQQEYNNINLLLEGKGEQLDLSNHAKNAQNES